MRFNWINWLGRHPNEFLLTLGSLLTAVGTVLLAILTYRQNVKNSGLTRQNQNIVNGRFLSQLYEDVGLMMSEGSSTIKDWINGLGISDAGFLPSNYVTRESVLQQRQNATQLSIKLDLYPNQVINPLVIQWLLIFSSCIESLSSMYQDESRNERGEYIISGQNLRTVIDLLKEKSRKLDQQMQIAIKNMSEELTKIFKSEN